MTVTFKLAASAALVGALCATQGWANDHREGQPLRFSVGFSAEATDNRDAREDDKQSNIDLYLRPRVEFFSGTQTTVLDLFYEPALRYRTEPGDEDDTELHHLFGANVSHSVSERLRLRLRNRLTVTDDPAIIEDQVVLRNDQSYFFNWLDAGLNYDLRELSNIDLLLRHRIRRYDDDLVAARSDIDEITFRLQHRHSLSPTLRSLLIGEIRDYSYSSSDWLDRDFNSFIVAAGLENVFTEQTVASLVVGWQIRNYSDDNFDSEGQAYVNAELSSQMGHDLRLGAIAGFGVRDSDAFPYASQEYIELKGYVDYRVRPQVNLRLAATYRMATYDSQQIVVGANSMELPGGDEDTFIGDLDLSYEVNEMLSVFIGGRIEDVSSDDDVGNSYSKSILRTGATLRF